MDILHNIDNRLSEISGKLDFYACLTPLNLEEERLKFFEALDKGEEYTPVFKYRERSFTDEKKELEELRAAIERREDELAVIFRNKIEYMSRQIDLLTSGDDRFTDIASGLYGAPEDKYLDMAMDILSTEVDEEEFFSEETVSPEEMAGIFTDSLEEKKIEGWKTLLSDKIVPKISVSGRDRTIYVNKTLPYTQEEVQRLKVHEIEVHVFRALNGERQPFKIFAEGLAGYDEAEEGLAIMAEERAGCLNIDKRQIRLYAGRYLSVCLALRGSFSDGFISLADTFPREIAYRLAERAKRGIVDTSLKGAFTKGLHYVGGLGKIREYMTVSNNINILYSGKIGFGDIDPVKKLMDEGILAPPKYLPESL